MTIETTGHTGITFLEQEWSVFDQLAYFEPSNLAAVKETLARKFGSIIEIVA